MKTAAWKADHIRQTALINSGLSQESSALAFQIDASGYLEPEFLASAFLVTNAYLMGLHNRGILKIFTLTEKDEILTEATENALRALLLGNFSALSNLDIWIKNIEQCGNLPPNIVNLAEQTVRNLSSFDSRKRGFLLEPADVVLVVSDTEADDRLSIDLSSKEIRFSALGQSWQYPTFRLAQGHMRSWAISDEAKCFYFAFSGETKAEFFSAWSGFLKEIDRTWNLSFDKRI